VTLICQLTGHCKTLMICELSLIWFTCIVQDLGRLKCYLVSVFAIMTFIVTFSAPIATEQQNFVWQAHFEIVTDLVFDIYFVILLGKCNYLTAVSVTQFLTLAFLQSDWLFRNCPSEIPLINYTMKFHSFYHKDLLVSTCFSNEKMPDWWSATGVDNKTHLLVILR